MLNRALRSAHRPVFLLHYLMYPTVARFRRASESLPIRRFFRPTRSIRANNSGAVGVLLIDTLFAGVVR
jgi:hypothetical protein